MMLSLKLPVIEFRAYVTIDGKKYAAYGETDGNYYILDLPGNVLLPKGTTGIEVYMVYKDKQFKVMTSIYGNY